MAKRGRPPGRRAWRIVELLYALDESPGLTISELARRLGWNLSTTRWYLWHSQKDGDVTKEFTGHGENGRYRRYQFYLKSLEE